MNRRMDGPSPEKRENLFRTSAIFALIDRFAAGIYSLLKNGFFGRLLSAYPKKRSDLCGGALSFLKEKLLLPVRRSVSLATGENFLFSLPGRLTAYLLRLRLRVYGTFLLTFGLYAAAMFLLPLVSDAPSASFLHLAASVVVAVASLPLTFSELSLSEALIGSRTGQAICHFVGIRKKDLRAEGYRGHSNVAFILGMLFGLITYFVPVLYILLGFAGVFLLYRIFRTPEVGVVVLFFAMPFLPTMVLVALTLYTALSYLVKLFLGKREARFEAVDWAALVFAFSVLLSGVFSFSTGSVKPALVQLCFMGGYFLTVLLIRTDEWLHRCTFSAIAAGSLVSLYGILQYFTGNVGQSGAWIDTTMFEDISDRVVSTLENPNMLAEYLILLLPIAAARFIAKGPRTQRAAAFCATALMALCTVFTWSRGAWLGLIFGVLVFLLVWNRRSLYLIFAGIASIPFLPLVLPDSIVNRFTSIGNLADSSTSYRVHIWRGAMHMLKDYWYCGIGIGEAAWGTVYPRYALAAIETAPHSHNLYLQVFLESGLAGILTLLAFLFLLCQVNFSFFFDLSAMRKSLSDSVSGAHLKTSSTKSAPASVQNGTAEQVAKDITALRLFAAAPLAGVLSTLVQGLTDYTWYNYRVFLMFWLTAGLSAAYVRRGRVKLENARSTSLMKNDSKEEADTEISLASVPPSTRTKKGTPPHV